MAYPKMFIEGNYWNPEVIIVALYADFLWIINIRVSGVRLLLDIY